ncbi:DUF349 domain-containing protein [Pseudonocardia asaccharolytica]|uniref:DNA repair ATPase n=1 Tax=Pseudonocardia asaccharolytica DSM 44247 = NBRC 16224 TaxID=1123024 RepID=A0A511D2J1_9PSEU|nr:DUF349 domain-containing protein [Pseudonocardia asaccharolytica]GEL19001.1 hypothetical protein PA7_28380 [Pseudonocardia asaccharolytica DSM 44247 = NBRC 16224]
MSEHHATSGTDERRRGSTAADLADRRIAPDPEDPRPPTVDSEPNSGENPGHRGDEAGTGGSRPATPRPPVPGPPSRRAPGPRPGPAARPAPSEPRPAPAPPRHPVPDPAPVLTPPTPTPVAQAGSDPSRWGRVDAEGTIYLITAEGQRVVGSWQAGSPEEGLAHFARRFDDLLTEAELLAARLTAGGDPKHSLHSAKALRQHLDEAAVIGDVTALRTRIDELVAFAEQSVGAARSAREAQRAAAIARKEELAAEAEHLAAEATQWKQAGDRFKSILDEWRAIKGIDRKTDEALWKRFSRARESFNRRRGSHFADLDRQRAGAKARKEELVAEAEALADSTDWGPTAARYRDLMTEWKAAGRAQKDADDALWQRFRSAQDVFFRRRAATYAERDAEFVANAEAKRALLGEAEKIDVSDPDAARAALRSIQERWEALGKVPREDIRPLEARLRAVEEKVREAADRHWRRTDPEAEARVAQFRERVAQFEAQAAKARATGDLRRAERAQSQADQWREWLATAEQAVQQR